MLTYEDFDYYQLAAESTAIYDHEYYPYASLMIEAAEYADLLTKPLLRGDEKFICRDELISEAGDVLWNLAVSLKRRDIKFSEVAKYNLKKLERRKENNTIMGDGDR